MKAIVLFSLFVLAVAEIEYYTVNDHLDMEALIGNVTKLQTLVDCFLDRAPCSELLLSYKDVMPESVQQACMRCNPNQKYQFWSFLHAVKLLLPEEYENYRKHYDPDNKYFDALEKEISKYTVRVAVDGLISNAQLQKL